MARARLPSASFQSALVEVIGLGARGGRLLTMALDALAAAPAPLVGASPAPVCDGGRLGVAPRVSLMPITARLPMSCRTPSWPQR